MNRHSRMLPARETLPSPFCCLHQYQLYFPPFHFIRLYHGPETTCNIHYLSARYVSAQNHTFKNKIFLRNTFFLLLNVLLRGRDSNPRPLGYEPNELPTAPPHEIGNQLSPTKTLWLCFSLCLTDCFNKYNMK
jgi:hypothetical protein